MVLGLEALGGRLLGELLRLKASRDLMTESLDSCFRGKAATNNIL